MDKVKQLQ